MSNQIVLSVVFGFLVSIALHFLVTSSYHSTIYGGSCGGPLVDCVSLPSAYTNGWPLVTSESLYDFRDTTDDYTRAITPQIMITPLRSGQSTSDDHFIQYSDTNKIYYPVGFMLNWSIFSSLTFCFIHLLHRRGRNENTRD